MSGMFDLTGRVAVVTGGNGGLGYGIATALLRAGCGVSIWARNAAKNQAATAELAAFGRVEAEQCDITDPASVERAMQATLDKFGRVDGCFANAGIGGGNRKPFTDITAEDWSQMLSINLGGAFHTIQTVCRHMTQRAAQGDPFGRLVLMSSTAAIFGAARNEHYSASKAGLNGLMRALAVEFAAQGITANAILGGYARSAMTAELMANDKFMDKVLPRVPMRRFGEPEDFGGIAVYLMSGASGYHTGDSLVIDGGYSVF